MFHDDVSADTGLDAAIGELADTGASAPLPAPGKATRPDLRPILLRPAATEDYLSDKGDILDLVRRRIKERALEPKDIRLTIKGWRPEEHYRVTCGFYDCDISQRRAYQLAAAVGLKRTKTLPWCL